MKRLLDGFTLAEALITLAIIGVIASMTLPTLATNSLRQQAASGLSKAINTLESANALALQQGNVRNLIELGAGTNFQYFDVALAPYLQMTQTNIANQYRDINNNAQIDLGEGATAFSTQDGITFIVNSANAISVFNLRRLPLLAFSGTYYSVFVDINGISKGPNIRGRDLYELIVDTKGVVLPVGSEFCSNYLGLRNLRWQQSCSSPNNITNSRSCAGAIVDNGYRVIHF